MSFRSSRSAPIAELGQFGVSSRQRVALIVSVPALSLLVPGLAVEVASAGGTGELPRIAGAVAKFLLFYSGVFALIGLSAAVAAGLLAADRIVLSPHARILSQTAHRTTSLIGMSALGNHIMLEIMANRAGIADSMIPFLAARSTLFMGLGTISSDVFVLVIITGVLRRRFAAGSRPELWRWLHMTAYCAWLLGVLHGLLAGRSAKPYVDWSYGACLALAALALVARFVVEHRHRSAAAGDLPGPRPMSLSSLPSMMAPASGPAARALPQPPASGPARALPPPADAAWSQPHARPAQALPPPADAAWSQPHARPARALPPPADAAWSQPHARPVPPPAVAPRPQPRPAAPAPQPRPLRALPSPDDRSSRPWPRPPGWTAAPWSAADAGDAGDAHDAGDNGYAPDTTWTESPDTWTESADAWRSRPDGWNR